MKLPDFQVEDAKSENPAMPCFILKGDDFMAPMFIRLWAALQQNTARAITALAHAKEMEEYCEHVSPCKDQI